MPDAIPHKFICECGQVLINHYPSQIIKHRLSKKHALKLIERIKLIEEEEINKIKQEQKKGSVVINFD
tara:strand:- start:429 stop:632 length:204 start_codon:yes stop_codon:yes gene_type:complete